jgi:putative copper resistance protein D
VWLTAALVAAVAVATTAGTPWAASGTSAAAGIDGGGPLLGALLALSYCAGIVTLGFLLRAAFLDPQGREGYLSRLGRTDLLVAARAAALWAVLALLAALSTFAAFLGLPLPDALTPSLLSTYFLSVPQVDALMLCALLAAVIAATTFVTGSLGPAATCAGLAALALAAPAFAVHPDSLGDHSLAMTAGTLQVLAGATWVGTLLAWCWRSQRQRPARTGSTGPDRRVTLVAAAVVAASGAALLSVRLSSPGQLLTTGYGRLVLVKCALFALALLLGLAAVSGRSRRVRAASVPAVASEVLVLSVAVGVSVGMGLVAQPRTDVGPGDLAEQLLGYRMPPMWTWTRILLGWSPDTFFLVGGLTAAALYVWGAWRLHRRADRWPVGRTAAWLSGIAVLLWSTNAGIATYASAMFSWHMLQHMMLSMLVPVFLVLGAPITLALRALTPAHGSRRGPREWLVWALDTPVVRILTQPVVALLFYTVSVYVLYFTPLFGSLMLNHIGHLAMLVHFLVSGYIFYWVVVGIDYAPRRLPYWGRLVLLVASLPLHAFFAVVIMQAPYPLDGSWFALVQPPWLTDLVGDQYVAGGIAWAFGEVPTLVVVLALAAQWARSDEREARRRDRAADRDGDAELVAYNDRLRRLADADRLRAGEGQAGHGLTRHG